MRSPNSPEIVLSSGTDATPLDDVEISLSSMTNTVSKQQQTPSCQPRNSVQSVRNYSPCDYSTSESEGMIQFSVRGTRQMRRRVIMESDTDDEIDPARGNQASVAKSQGGGVHWLGGMMTRMSLERGQDSETSKARDGQNQPGSFGGNGDSKSSLNSGGGGVRRASGSQGSFCFPAVNDTENSGRGNFQNQRCDAGDAENRRISARGNVTPQKQAQEEPLDTDHHTETIDGSEESTSGSEKEDEIEGEQPFNHDVQRRLFTTPGPKQSLHPPNQINTEQSGVRNFLNSIYETGSKEAYKTPEGQLQHTNRHDVPRDDFRRSVKGGVNQGGVGDRIEENLKTPFSGAFAFPSSSERGSRNLSGSILGTPLLFDPNPSTIKKPPRQSAVAGSVMQNGNQHMYGTTPCTPAFGKGFQSIACQSVQPVPKTVTTTAKRAPGTTGRGFNKMKKQLAQNWFEELNRTVFNNQLPADLKITWNPRMLTTGGRAFCKKELIPGFQGQDIKRYISRVELATKVLDNEERLRATLAHELCHVAAWVIDHNADPPHGPIFKKWGQKVQQKFPHILVTTCHNYSIHKAYRWQCQQCGMLYKRHSKSINIDKEVCGVCKGPLQFLGKFNSNGTQTAPRTPSAFSTFVKENYAAIKAATPKTPHAVVMQKLSQKWKEVKMTK